MAGVWNVNTTYEASNDKIFTKLKLENNEIFRARVVDFDTETDEVSLKLMNGWQIKAKVAPGSKALKEEFYYFKVREFENNEIKLNILDKGNEEEVVKSNNLNKSEENGNVLKMLNKNITISKDNINYIKTLFSIIEDEDRFINDIVSAKNIDVESEEGKKIVNLLRNFSTSLKSLDSNDVLSLIENNIEISKDNIESFKSINKESYAIFKDLLDINSSFNDDNSIKKMEYMEKVLTGKLNSDVENTLTKDIISQIKSRIEDLASETRNIIEQSSNISKGDFSKLITDFSKNINDFKVFNSISNEYVYLDIPLKFKEQEYEFKLVIKEDRKRGKKVDKECVKLAISLNTKNVGTVDSFLKIKNKYIDVDINCDKNFKNLFEKNQDNLKKGLESLGYIVCINIVEKKNQVNIANYTDFFQDNGLYSLNTIV